MNISHNITTSALTNNGEVIGVTYNKLTGYIAISVGTADGNTDTVDSWTTDQYFEDFFNPTYDEVVEFFEDYPNFAIVFPYIREQVKSIYSLIS